MKRKAILCNLILILILCCGCNSKKDTVVFLEDSVMVEIQNPEDDYFAFFIHYIYQGKQPDLRLVSVDGENLTGVSYSYNDVTSEFQDTEYKGYKMGTAGVRLELNSSAEQTVTINEVTFSVNDTEQTVKFEYPLAIVLDNKDTASYITSLAGDMSMSFCEINSEASFTYSVTEDITIESISLGKYIELGNMTITIDKYSNGNEEVVGGIECLPLDVPKDATVMIKGTATSEYDTGYQNWYTTAIVRYSHAGDTYNHRTNIVVGRYENEEMVEKAIDSISDNK